MPTVKSIKINTMTQDDLTALFDAIANKIILKKPFDVKKEILNIKGNNHQVNNYKPGMLDILRLVALYDVKCEFKVFYVDGEVKQAIELPDPPKEEPVKAEMKKQAVVVVVPQEIEKPVVEKPQALNSLDIPDFEA